MVDDLTECVQEKSENVFTLYFSTSSVKLCLPVPMEVSFLNEVCHNATASCDGIKTAKWNCA